MDAIPAPPDRFGNGEVPLAHVGVSALELIDWNFCTRPAPEEIEAIHPYPAKFIGELPRALIRNLELKPGTLILDPFCGSGTTLVEAQKASLQSIGIDLNPIGCLISRVKTSPLPPGLLTAAEAVVSKAQTISAKPPDIPNLSHWFKPEVQRAVSSLAVTIAESDFAPWFDALRLSLSSILVRVSNQDSDTRYAAVSKPVGYDNVMTAFSNAVGKLARALEKRTWNLANAQVITANTLSLQPSEISGRIGIVITSPPYPNAYEYWLYHKYRMWWLGFDPLYVKSHEIGARAHFFKKNHHTAQNFVDQMKATLRLLDRVLVRRGYACFVVGRSRIHGRIVDNAKIIIDAAADQGMKLVVRTERQINATRKSFNLSHANIKTETVLVLQKR